CGSRFLSACPTPLLLSVWARTLVAVLLSSGAAMQLAPARGQSPSHGPWGGTVVAETVPHQPSALFSAPADIRSSLDLGHVNLDQMAVAADEPVQLAGLPTNNVPAATEVAEATQTQ